MSLDGLYIDDIKGNPLFRRVGPPTDAEVARVAERVRRRVMRLMEQRGLGPQADPEEADALRRDEPLLTELYRASIAGRVATGPRAGKRIVRVGDGPDFENAVMKPGNCCALVEGFSVHAGVCVPARDHVRASAEICCASAAVKREAFAPAGRQASLQTQASLE